LGFILVLLVMAIFTMQPKVFGLFNTNDTLNPAEIVYNIGSIKTAEAAIPKTVSDKQDARRNTHIRCLAKNIFYEARGTSMDEKIRVVNVTLNRAKDSKFPNDVCGVIMQYRQFSWTLEKHKMSIPVENAYQDKPGELKEWKSALILAEKGLDNKLPDLTDGAMYYHRTNMKPKTWDFSKLTKVETSEWHHYYKDRHK